MADYSYMTRVDAPPPILSGLARGSSVCQTKIEDLDVLVRKVMGHQFWVAGEVVGHDVTLTENVSTARLNCIQHCSPAWPLAEMQRSMS